MKLRVEPTDLRELPAGTDGAGGVPVDEGDRDAFPGQDVPKPKVTVADHRPNPGQRRSGCTDDLPGYVIVRAGDV